MVRARLASTGGDVDILRADRVPGLIVVQPVGWALTLAVHPSQLRPYGKAARRRLSILTATAGA